MRWLLSVDPADLPKQIAMDGQRTFRSIKIGDREIEFSGGFTDLHTLSYQEILAGRGFGVEDARPSVNAVYNIRNANSVGMVGDYHPLLKERIHD